LVREEAGRDLLDTLADYLRYRNVLLVLDNCEQIIEAGATIARLLDAASRLTVLATSRAPFRISAEHEYQVPRLVVPDLANLEDPEVIARSEAVALFTERASAIRPGFRVTSQNVADVAEITTRLDGLPLAIELAASRIRVLSLQALRQRLSDRLALLTSGARDLPERQRTLRRTIEWSHDLLEPEEQRLLARLGTFSGGWTLQAAEAICRPGLDVDVIESLDTLVGHSLVQPGKSANGETRFTLLETIREFALERLTSSGEEGELRRRHAEHFGHLAEEAERNLTRADRVRWLARLESEHENLRAALDWAERTGNTEAGLRTAAAIWRFWLLQGHLSEGRAPLERLLSMPRASARDPVRARALSALGGLAYWQNDYPPMRAAYQEAVEIARAVGDAQLLASALLDLSFIPYLERDFARAEAVLREGLATAEQAGDPIRIAEFWSTIAGLEVVRGNPPASIEPWRTAIQIFRQEGEEWRLGNQLGGLAAAMQMLGDLDAAKEHLGEALQLAASADDMLSVSGALTGLALAANDEGDYQRAARLGGAVARIRDDLGGGVPPELLYLRGNPDEDARHALGEGLYQGARAEGYAMTAETAVAYALERDGR
jgi:predicted ATPase